jgi:hypothetical protein
MEARRIFHDVLTAARERTQDAIDTLFAIMRDPKAPAAARVSAAQAILDRGYGKPPQAIEVNAEPDLAHLSDEDLQTLERILSHLRHFSRGAGRRPQRKICDTAGKGLNPEVRHQRDHGRGYGERI